LISEPGRAGFTASDNLTVSASVVLHIRNKVQVAFADGTFISRLKSPLELPLRFRLDHNVGEVEMDEDHVEHEVSGIFLDDEVASDDENAEVENDARENSTRIEDVETQIVLRGRQRIRHCLAGCECEKERGRKCECERRGNGLCGAECECDRTKCRTTAKDASDSDE
jgi:hypothetical protein